MKVTYFRLKGYVKVLNGMGLDEIVIDFSKFKNRIVLIQGENGCSKSTIVAALTPTPDSSDSFRTDVFFDNVGNRQIVEYPAEKEIHYIGKDECGNDAYYVILIKSIVNDSKTSRTTKAFISKNGEELNPNGNVSSFKEIRDSVLGIDPTYLDLSSISSENRGIVDMIPSDRRKYMAAYIGSLDTYNNIFKVISKKVSSLKSYMNTLNAKIYELGNENEMRLKLMQLETSLKELNDSRDKLLKNLAEAEATVKLIDPDNRMQDLYTSISERLASINLEIKENEQIVISISSALKIDLGSIDIDSAILETKSTIDTHNQTMSDNKSRISTLMSLNESTIQSIESDRSILNGMDIDSIQDNIENVVDNLNVEIASYRQHLDESDILVLKSTSVDELTDLRDALELFKKNISTAEDMYMDEDFQRAIDNCLTNNSLQNAIVQMNSTMASNTAKIESYEAKVVSMEEDIQKLQSFKNMRPAECTIDSCPYISNYISMMNSVGTQDDVDNLKRSIESLIRENNDLSTKIESAVRANEIVRVVDESIMLIIGKKSVLRKIEKLKYLTEPDNIKALIKAHYRFQDFQIVTRIIEKAYMYSELGKAEEQLKGLEGDIKIYRNNKILKEKLSKSIEKGESEYKDREEEIKNLTKDCIFLDKIIGELNSKLEKLQFALDATQKLESLDAEKSDLRAEFDSVKDKIKLVKEKMDSLNDIRNNISKVEESISPLSDMISKVKYDLSTIINYQEEFQSSSDKYEKMVFIRNACSPGNGMGIQSEYIKRYMNDIIIDCNKMLGYMFNGQIQLDVPMIDEKHFAIPFIGPNGLIVPDISAGSTAQKCMIGLVFSCVAMMKSSLRYNIPRFDEIDGGLDQQNRIVFINVLNNILDFMGSEQCIIVSHNNEFDTQHTTRLLCSHTGIRVEQ